jgi:hypothetical protein
MLLAVLAATPPPVPPFRARLTVETAYVRSRAEAAAPIIGVVRSDGEVVVTGCLPDCKSPGAWALLDGDGAIRLDHLRVVAAGEPPPPAPQPYRYGRVRSGGARVYRSPDVSARVIQHRPAGQDLAFLPDDALEARGWLPRVGGGFVPAARIRWHVPSTFQGVPRPSLPLAFAVRDSQALSRHAAASVVSADAGTVEVSTGRVPRRSVRIAYLRPRPDGIPAGARWVDVDLREQTLVAYEGDTPVFATLVSTGRADRPTRRGLFSVYEKESRGRMHGDEPKPYFVDQVPFIQYFHGDMALHGTFWHDRFGEEMSHGCVNLSMADAERLFDWALPRLPKGWHAVDGSPPASSWVMVERRAPFWKRPSGDQGRIATFKTPSARDANRW